MSKYDEQPIDRDDSVATTDENVRDIAAGSTGGRAASPDERAAALDGDDSLRGDRGRGGSALGDIAGAASDEDRSETGGAAVIDATKMSGDVDDRGGQGRLGDDRIVQDREVRRDDAGIVGGDRDRRGAGGRVGEAGAGAVSVAGDDRVRVDPDLLADDASVGVRGDGLRGDAARADAGREARRGSGLAGDEGRNLEQGQPGNVCDDRAYARDERENLEQGHPGYISDEVDEDDERPRLVQGHPGYMDDEGNEVRQNWGNDVGVRDDRADLHDDVTHAPGERGLRDDRAGRDDTTGRRVGPPGGEAR